MDSGEFSRLPSVSHEYKFLSNLSFLFLDILTLKILNMPISCIYFLSFNIYSDFYCNKLFEHIFHSQQNIIYLFIIPNQPTIIDEYFGIIDFSVSSCILKGGYFFNTLTYLCTIYRRNLRQDFSRIKNCVGG